MSKIFNISFPYGDSVYNALLTIKGGDDVHLRVEQDQIEIYLPHGNLSFPINEVVGYFSRLHQQNDLDMVMPVTKTISLHLMSTNLF